MKKVLTFLLGLASFGRLDAPFLGRRLLDTCTINISSPNVHSFVLNFLSAGLGQFILFPSCFSPFCVKLMITLNHTSFFFLNFWCKKRRARLIFFFRPESILISPQSQILFTLYDPTYEELV